MPSGVVLDDPALAPPGAVALPSDRDPIDVVAGWEARSPWATLAVGQGVPGGVGRPHIAR